MDEKEQGPRDAGQRRASEEPNSAIRPLLQAPGNLQLPHRITNFFIDNILRPDFGRKKDVRITRDGDSHSTEESRNTPDPSTGHVGRSVPTEGTSSTRTSSEGKKAEIEGEEALKPHEETEECSSSDLESSQSNANGQSMLWPAWVYCTRYSDRPSSGPRSRKPKKKTPTKEDKRPRTAFTAEQLQRLKTEFQGNRYLTEQRRQSLAQELGLNESQIKIWFQNKRAKIKKASGVKNNLALHLMAQGLYNHSTTSKEDKSDSD